MDLKGMGTAIAEALALKFKIQPYEVQVKTLNDTILSNRKEIDRLTKLIEATNKLESDKKGLKTEIADIQVELDKRLKKLAEEGVILPVGSGSRGTVSL